MIISSVCYFFVWMNVDISLKKKKNAKYDGNIYADSKSQMRQLIAFACHTPVMNSTIISFNRQQTKKLNK